MKITVGCNMNGGRRVVVMAFPGDYAGGRRHFAWTLKQSTALADESEQYAVVRISVGAVCRWSLPNVYNDYSGGWG